MCSFLVKTFNHLPVSLSAVERRSQTRSGYELIILVTETTARTHAETTHFPRGGCLGPRGSPRQAPVFRRLCGQRLRMKVEKQLMQTVTFWKAEYEG